MVQEQCRLAIKMVSKQEQQSPPLSSSSSVIDHDVDSAGMSTDMLSLIYHVQVVVKLVGVTAVKSSLAQIAVMK